MERNHAVLVRSCFIAALGLLIAGGSLPASGVAMARTSVKSIASYPDKSSFCSALGHHIQASSGAQMACFGPQVNGAHATTTSSFTSTNRDAATPSEDVTPNGTQAYGQSEVSTAASGSNVVEAWNDATGFFAPPCSPSFKDQLTGYGFSSNGGGSFTDLGGLPNVNCATGSKWAGDPSVEVWSPGGTTYFYISSLIEGGDCNFLCVAVTTCKVTGTSLNCNSTPTELMDLPSGFNIEDKDFMSIDPLRGRLYISFTDFAANTNGEIRLWGCDIGTSTGGTGPSGGSAGNPVCASANPVADSTGCNELEGAYPAVDRVTGDVYIAFEDNWATNLFGCFLPVTNDLAVVPGTCLNALPLFVGCSPYNSTSVGIVTMDAAFIAGYNRFPMNDFPRIAVSDQFGKVSIVWNDARFHANGDILLESFGLGSLTPVQAKPARINSSTGGNHLLPALRNVDDDGDLQISFYSRASGTTANTDVMVAIDVSPLATGTPANVKVTSVATNWTVDNSDIIPNFGDYTDNYVQAKNTAPYTTQKLYIAWSDGRLGFPQPFNAHHLTS
jgi:hypothetical protein